MVDWARAMADFGVGNLADTMMQMTEKNYNFMPSEGREYTITAGKITALGQGSKVLEIGCGFGDLYFSIAAFE